MFVPIYYIYIYIYICVFKYMYVYIYMNVWKYECMNVCMFKMKGCAIPSLGYIFWKPKKHVGGYISCGQVKYFSEISCLTPPTIPGRVKGGGCATLGTHIGHKSWQVHIHGNLCVDAYRGMCTCFAGLQCYHLKSYHAWQSNETIYFRQIS